MEVLQLLKKRRPFAFWFTLPMLSVLTLSPLKTVLAEEPPTVESLTEIYRDLGEKTPDTIKQAVTSDKGTRASEIARWQSLSHRYAVGLGTDGEVKAITDLAMENHMSARYIKRTLIGAIGIGDLNLKNLIDFIKDMIHQRNPSEATAEEQSEWRAQYLPRDLQKITKVYRNGQMEDLLDSYSKRFGESSTSLPDGWWNKIAWKNPVMGLAESAPAQFRASDINLYSMARMPRTLHKLISKFAQTFRTSFGVPVSNDLLDHFEFVKNEQGGYDCFFVPAKDQESVNAMLGLGSPYDPMIVADVAHSNPSIWRPIGITLLRTLLDQMLNLIPNKVASALVRYPVDRWFHLYLQQWAFHHLGILEGINLTYNGDNSNPFSTLDEDVRNKAAHFIYKSDADIFKLIFGMTTLNHWRKDIAKDLSKSERSMTWLGSKGYAFEGINAWFTRATAPNHRRIYSLADNYLFFKYPMVAVDYDHPDLERIRRNLVAVFDFGLLLIDPPIMGASTVIKLLYSYLVKQPIEKSQGWEARLASDLFFSQENTGTNWEWEIDHLYKNRLNAFELSRKEEEDMITKRRQLLNLPLDLSPAPSYVSGVLR